MNEKLSQGLTNLAQTVLKRTVSEEIYAKITPEHIAKSSDIILNHLSSLPSGEQIVLIDRFGVITGKPKTLEAVSEDLGIKRIYVSQIELNALMDLRVAALSDLIEIMRDIKNEAVSTE